jgi:hypothetical protein
VTPVLKIFGATLLTVLFSHSAVLAQSSTDSQLNQEITAFECNYTTVVTGLGKTHSGTCPPFTPTIAIINTNMGRPTITGVYDAVHTKALRVQVNNQWYTLGIDIELTVNGNVWVLNLSNAQHTLSSGDYLIIVETEDNDGVVRRGEATMKLLIGNPAGGDDTVTPSSEQPYVPDFISRSSIQNLLENPLLPLSIVAALIGWASLFITIMRRRNGVDIWRMYYAIMHSKTPEWPSTTSQQEEQDNTPY